MISLTPLVIVLPVQIPKQRKQKGVWCVRYSHFPRRSSRIVKSNRSGWLKCELASRTHSGSIYLLSKALLMRYDNSNKTNAWSLCGSIIRSTRARLLLGSLCEFGFGVVLFLCLRTTPGCFLGLWYFPFDTKVLLLDGSRPLWALLAAILKRYSIKGKTLSYEKFFYCKVGKLVF